MVENVEYLGIMDAACLYAWGAVDGDRAAAGGERTLASVSRLQTAAQQGLIEISGLPPAGPREIIPALQWLDLRIDVLGDSGGAVAWLPGESRPAWRALMIERGAVFNLAGTDRQPWHVEMMANLDPPPIAPPAPEPSPIEPEPPAAPDSAGPAVPAATVEPAGEPAQPAAPEGSPDDEDDLDDAGRPHYSPGAVEAWVRDTIAARLADGSGSPPKGPRGLERMARAHFRRRITREWVDEAWKKYAPAAWQKAGRPRYS